MATAKQIASPGVYVSDDVGLEVTDGAASRVQLGLLPSGQYGLRLAGPNLSGEISGSVPSIVLGTPGAQITDNGVEVPDGTNVRVKLGKISATPTYGLKVVSSDGTTVIIDGTSDMFRIVATGTQSVAFPAPNNAAGTNTALTGLGEGYSIPPACLWNTTYDNTVGGGARQNDSSTATNLATGVVKWEAFSYVVIGPGVPGHPIVSLAADSYTNNPGTTAACRYYVLAQAAI